jgi:hypothetical protein
VILDRALADRLDFEPVPRAADAGADEGDSLGRYGFLREAYAQPFRGLLADFLHQRARGVFFDDRLRRLLADADAELAQRLADGAGEDHPEDVAAELGWVVERPRIEQRRDRAGHPTLDAQHRGHVRHRGGEHREWAGRESRRRAGAAPHFRAVFTAARAACCASAFGSSSRASAASLRHSSGSGTSQCNID